MAATPSNEPPPPTPSAVPQPQDGLGTWSSGREATCGPRAERDGPGFNAPVTDAARLSAWTLTKHDQLDLMRSSVSLQHDTLYVSGQPDRTCGRGGRHVVEPREVAFSNVLWPMSSPEGVGEMGRPDVDQKESSPEFVDSFIYPETRVLYTVKLSDQSTPPINQKGSGSPSVLVSRR